MNPALNRDYSKYYTRPETADLLVEMADIQEDMTILEPSAGSGAIVKAIRGIWSDSVEIHAVEIKPFVVCQQLIQSNADITIIGDFLKVPLEGAEYHRFIANPPFGNETDLTCHWVKMYNCLRTYGIIVSIVPSDFVIPKSSVGKELKRVPLENWGTNKDGTVTPICIVVFGKHWPA